MSDATILSERLRGRTLKDLADSNGMTPEGIRYLVAKEGRRTIDAIELDLLANTKRDQLSGFAIPGNSGPDFDAAMAYIAWVVRSLEERGLSIAVHYRPTYDPPGVVLMLEDVTRRRS